MSRQQTQQVARIMITLIAAIAIVPIVIVIAFLIINGLEAISWEFLSQPPRSGMTEGGIMPAIVGTIFLTLGTAIAAIPLGLLSYMAFLQMNFKDPVAFSNPVYVDPEGRLRRAGS